MNVSKLTAALASIVIVLCAAAVAWDSEGDASGSGYDPDRELSSYTTLGNGTVIDAESSVSAGYDQGIVVSGDVTVVAGGAIAIEGGLTILEGSTLTVETGGSVTVTESGIVDVAGTLRVGAGTDGYAFSYSGVRMNVSGAVILEGEGSFRSDGDGMTIAGTFTVGADATADLGSYGMTIGSGGELAVYGVAEGAVRNGGTVVVDSEGIDGATTELTVMALAGATVRAINGYGLIDVVDGYVLQDDGTYTEAENDNRIQLSMVSGVTVTGTVADGTGSNYINTLRIGGDAAPAYDSAGEAGDGLITVCGDDQEVAGTLTLAEGVRLGIEGGLTVSGEVRGTYLDAEGSGQIVGMGGTLTVTGRVTVGAGIADCIVNAASYSSGGTVTYTSLGTALGDGATSIALTGRNAVSGEVAIPAGTSVTMEPYSVIVIGEEAVLRIESSDSSGRLDTSLAGDYSVVVDGTLYVDSIGRSGMYGNPFAVLSDTATVSGDSAVFTNIADALDAASEGDTVSITRNAGAVSPAGSGVELSVTLSGDVRVPEGVTLLVPADQSLSVGSGAAVTVEGTLHVIGDFAVPEEHGAVVVDGLLLFPSGLDGLHYADVIDGAYLDLTVDGAVVRAVAPLNSVPDLMGSIASYIVEVVGDTTVGDIDLSSYEGDTVTIVSGLNSDGDLTFSSLTLGGSVRLSSFYSGTVTGTIVLDDGSVDVSKVCGFDAWNGYDPETGASTSMISGGFDGEDGGSVTFHGEVSTSARTYSRTHMVVASDATVTVTGSTMFNGDVAVYGRLVIGDGGARFSVLTAFGTVYAAGTSTATAAELYVGVTADDLGLSGEGSVSGVLPHDRGSFVYVSPEATYLADGVVSTEYLIGDDPYLSAYALRNNRIPIADITFTVENAYMSGWQYYDGDEAVTVGNEAVGAASQVYAVIERHVYNITVIADEGIGSVSVDGVQLVSSGGNVYTLSEPVAAGAHSVIYTLRSGYEGTATLSVESGPATVSGLTFAVSGTPETAAGLDVTLSLTGTDAAEPPVIVDVEEGEDEKDEGGGISDTQLLLVIIVALIVVMAALLALKLRDI